MNRSIRLIFASATWCFCGGFSASSSAPATPLQGPGQLAVAPTKIVLDGKERASELVLVNKGSNEATYRVSLVDMRMTEDGRLERLPAGTQNEFSAKPILRYSPKQITLGPGESQRIRIAVQKTPNLPIGEYRSHLLFEALPKAAVAGSGFDPSSLTLKFSVIGAVSLPVFVRQGKLKAEAHLEQPKLSGDGLLMRLLRSGERTVRGDLTAYFVPDNSKSKSKIGLIRELALYAPNTERQVRMPLSIPQGIQLRRGKILVTFEEPPATKDRARASAELALPD